MNAAPVIIELAGVPVGKGRPRFVRSTGVAFTPSKTRKFESHLRLAAQVAMAGRQPIEGAVEMVVRVDLPVPKSWSKAKQSAALLGLIRPTGRPDVDNYLKSASDALNEIVLRDDSQIVDAFVRKFYSARPCLRIKVQEVGA